MSGITDELARVRRSLERERAARLEAEAVAERSIQALQERRRQLELLEAVAVAANQAETVEEALRVTLEALCTRLGYPLGHVFRVRGDELESSGLWHSADRERYQDFTQLTEATEFRRGVGLPGRVLESGRPVLIGDVKNDPGFIRMGPDSDLPIAGGFAFPVLVGHEIVAVIEVFSEALLEDVLGHRVQLVEA